MDSGAIPAKNACFQCYHPPVFYYVSAIVGNVATAFDVGIHELRKLLQFMNCLYGILTIGIVYLILGRLRLTNFSRLLSFGVVCFLPRHIYMSAMNSNDAMSYLFVAVSIYLLLVMFQKKLSILLVLAASAALSIAVFTKYTAYAVLPAAIASFALLYWKGRSLPRKRIAVSCGVLLFMPAVLLGVYWVSNTSNYGTPLPWNIAQLDPSATQPRDSKGPLDFVSFKPWESMKTLMIVPGEMHSFWTMVYSGMWFDNEPKFLYFLDSGTKWWMHYYAWLRGEERFPGENTSLSILTQVTGSGLIGLGLPPLLLIIIGFGLCFKAIRRSLIDGGNVEMAVMSIFPMLLIVNAGIAISLALRLPVFSAAKASYFLVSMPALAVFLGLGLQWAERRKWLIWIASVVFGLLFTLVTLHIVQLWWSIIWNCPYQNCS